MRTSSRTSLASRAGGEGCPASAIRCTSPLDPRAERILELADERGVSGTHVQLARDFRDAVAEMWGKPLPMNVSMPIAAVLLDLGFPAAAVEGGSDPRRAPRACSPTSPRSRSSRSAS